MKDWLRCYGSRDDAVFTMGSICTVHSVLLAKAQEEAVPKAALKF